MNSTRLVLCLLLAVGCTTERDGVVAQDELVSMVLEHDNGIEQLRLVPQTGVKISAQFKPTIQLEPGTPLVFDAGGRTADSAYFVSPPVAIINGRRPIHGTMRASACPQGKRVCLSVALPIDLP